jgi:hypothetical protein
VAILEVVVADLLIGQSLESLGNVYPVIINGLCGDVVREVLACFIGME